MSRPAAILIMMMSILGMEGQTVVADSVSRAPLPDASVFDRDGKPVARSGNEGVLPCVSPDSYPLTVRYLGYADRMVYVPSSDTVFMKRSVSDLRELVVSSQRRKVLHMLAYVREYSTMTNFSDTIFLFREKKVDYMFNHGKEIDYSGWLTPRILASKSYYRFTNAQGLDSVSDVSRHHFSWSDWVGLPPASVSPSALADAECAADTLPGRYGPCEIWEKNEDRMTVEVDVLADTVARKWIPALAGFFRDGLDFEKFRIRYDYDKVYDNPISPRELSSYSFDIESNGRGHDMFRFDGGSESFFVKTHAEVFVTDKEYVSVGEAKKLERWKVKLDASSIRKPDAAPELQPAILALVERVKSIDKDRMRLDFKPDQRLVSPFHEKRTAKARRKAASF